MGCLCGHSPFGYVLGIIWQAQGSSSRPLIDARDKKRGKKMIELMLGTKKRGKKMMEWMLGTRKRSSLFRFPTRFNFKARGNYVADGLLRSPSLRFGAKGFALALRDGACRM